MLSEGPANEGLASVRYNNSGVVLRQIPDDAVTQRHVHAPARRAGDQVEQVEVEQGISIEQQKAIVQHIARMHERAGGAERLGFARHDDSCPPPEDRGVVCLDDLRLVAREQENSSNAP